jgi:hypothetical protein
MGYLQTGTTCQPGQANNVTMEATFRVGKTHQERIVVLGNTFPVQLGMLQFLLCRKTLHNSQNIERSKGNASSS